ncbi:MAG: AMP-binding protein [Clostridia bacterium]
MIYNVKYEEVIKKLKNESNINLKHLICMDEQTDENTINKVIKKGEELIKQGNTEFLNAKINEKDLAVLIFTSGTTSASKAVMLSQYNIAKNIHDMLMVEKFKSSDVNIAFLPYHHAFGSTGQLVMLASGIQTVFPDGLKYIGQNLKEYGVTVFVGVPKLIEAIYDRVNKEIEKQGKTKLIKTAKLFTNFLLKCKIDVRRKAYKKIINNLGGLRFVISGAAALNKDVANGFYELGIETVQGYGLTETAPVVAAENYKYRKSGSIGFPMPSVDVEIVNKDENGIGELKVKGPNVMMGYYQNEKATKEVIKDGWFYTGDLAYRDKEGYIFIAGRKKNMIVLKNGKKIFPEEMEDLVNQIDLVEESFVFGMPKGDDLLLSVEIKYNEKVAKEKYPNLNEEEIKKLIWNKVKETNKLLPKYKYIKNMILTKEDFIKTSTQKIKRFEEIKKFI